MPPMFVQSTDSFRMEQNGSRFAGLGSRQAVCEAASHCSSRLLASLMTAAMFIASGGELAATAFVVVLNIASFLGLEAIGCFIIAAMAACIVQLTQENVRLTVTCNKLLAKPTADACTMTRMVCSYTPDAATKIEPASSCPESKSSSAKQPPAPAARQRLQPGSPSGPETPSASHRNSVREEPHICQQPTQQADSTTEVAVTHPAANAKDPTLLPAVNLTCKTRPTAATAAPADSSVVEPASPEGPATPTRLSEADTMVMPSIPAASSKGSTPAQPPLPPPLPPKPASSSSSSVAVPKPPPAAPPPPPPPRHVAALNGLQATSVGAAALPPPPLPPSVGKGLQAGARPPPPPPPTGAGAACSAAAAAATKPAAGKSAANSLPAGVSKAPGVAQLLQKVRRRDLEQAGQLVTKVSSKAAAATSRGGAVDCQAAASAVKAEIDAKGGRGAKIDACLAQHKAQLMKVAADTNKFKPDCLEAVPGFIGAIDTMLANAAGDCESEVLKRFDEWPTSRYEVIREVDAAYRSLKFLTERALARKAPTGKLDSFKLSDLRSNIKKQFDNLAAALAVISSGKTNLIRRSKEAGLPWDAQRIKQLTDAAKVASLNLARGYMAAAMLEATKIQMAPRAFRFAAVVGDMQ